MPIRVEFEGMDALMRQMRALGSDARKARKSALMAGSKIIAEEMKTTTPRSASPRGKGGKTQGWRTGQHVADVLKPTVEERTSTAFGGVTTPGGVTNGPHFYIRFLEYGTVRMSGRHMAVRAASTRTEAVAEAVGTELRKGLGL